MATYYIYFLKLIAYCLLNAMCRWKRNRPGTVAELVERWPRVWEIGSLVLGRVKSMTYKIDTCRFVAWHSTLIGYGKDGFAQCQENVTGRDIGSW